MTALFLNHRQQRCGVYQMGLRIGQCLTHAGVAQYVEASSLAEAQTVATSTAARVLIYNWHPSTLPWASELVRRLPNVRHVGLIHEISPDTPWVGSEIFPFRMVCDPSFPTTTSLFRSVRHVPRSSPTAPNNVHVTVGSFGFAVGGKMFATIAHAVGAEFPSAIVRLRIPCAHFGDDAGVLARKAARAAQDVTIGNVRVEVSHDFLSDEDLIQWLAGNDLNAFFYDPNGGRGISSVLDYAIAARRPIAINDSQMFRHVRERLGCYPARSLRASLDTRLVVEDLYNTWTPQRLAQDYAEMISALG